MWLLLLCSRILIIVCSRTAVVINCGTTCPNYTEQTIWDGDQVLGEIRTGGGFQQSGTIAYTHGGGLDAPLSLVRHGLTSGPVTIVPHSNWRGQYHAGSYTDGAVAGNSRLDLREVRWPAENAGAYLNPLRPFRRDAPWMGSLVQSSEDASGLMYRRNRYYDPKTGRFTQEDPIGLAGGLNTYGFADGDPVSYTDPYGLAAAADDQKNPLNFGNGYTGRVDQIGEIYEIHVYRGDAEVGVFGPNGWINKHGAKGRTPSVPRSVLNQINGENVSQLRRRGLIGERGTQNIRAGRYSPGVARLFSVVGLALDVWNAAGADKRSSELNISIWAYMTYQMQGYSDKEIETAVRGRIY